MDILHFFVLAGRPQHQQKSSSKDHKDCPMCKANRRRRLANYIRSKSRQDSESAIEEEEEEEHAGKQQQWIIFKSFRGQRNYFLTFLLWHGDWEKGLKAFCRKLFCVGLSRDLPVAQEIRLIIITTTLKKPGVYYINTLLPLYKIWFFELFFIIYLFYHTHVTNF